MITGMTTYNHRRSYSQATWRPACVFRRIRVSELSSGSYYLLKNLTFPLPFPRFLSASTCDILVTADTARHVLHVHARDILQQVLP